jgi:cytochrome c oxidase assembly factor CtaG
MYALRRLAAFALGLFVLWVALGSPLAALHHQLLSVHMVQHVLLMAIAPPLILIGAPLEPLLHAIPGSTIRPAWLRVRAVVMHPVVCWLAPVVALIAWHVPAVFTLALHGHGWHDVQAATFLATGLLFWSPVVRPSPSFTWPRWSIPLYLFAATLPCDALSAFLVFCGRVVYPAHASGPGVFGLSPLRDQELAGCIMWVAVTLIYVVPAMAVTMRLLSPFTTETDGDVMSAPTGPV